MKTKEELNAIKTEVEALNKKLREVTDEQLVQVAGGNGFDIPIAHSIAKQPRLEDSGENIDWEQLIEG